MRVHAGIFHPGSNRNGKSGVTRFEYGGVVAEGQKVEEPDLADCSPVHSDLPEPFDLVSRSVNCVANAWSSQINSFKTLQQAYCFL